MRPSNIGWVFILAIIFSTGCESGITQRYVAQQGHYEPVTDSTGKIVRNELSFDSVYKYVPTFSEKVQIAKHDGTATIAIILLIVGLAAIIYGIIYGNNAGKWVGLPVVLFCVAIALFGGAAGTINWAHTKEIEIPKKVWDIPAERQSFIDKELLK